MALFTVQVEISNGFTVWRRFWNRGRKRCLKAIGDWWVWECLPKHFTMAGAQEYKYAPRTPEYWGRSLRNRKKCVDANLPLVYTGTTRRMVRETAKPKVYGSGVTINMQVPGYIKASGYKTGHAYETTSWGSKEAVSAASTGGIQPDLEAELTAVSKKELEHMGEIFAEELARTFKHIGKATKRTVQ